MEQKILWITFASIVGVTILLDILLVQRRPHEMTLREASFWSGLWTILALGYAGLVFFLLSPNAGIQFLTGYVIELSLSADNVFLFAVIFEYFRVPRYCQRRVLTWGVFSAFVLRGLLIAMGAALLTRFSWMNYVFGAFLVLTGLKMFKERNSEMDPSESRLLHWLQKVLPLRDEYYENHFFTRIDGKLLATRLFLVLAMVEMTDVLFALDSIPATFAITRDPLIVFTSNIFAIMGLRSLYFLLAGLMERFHYLSVGLSFVLVFVGCKMLGTIWDFHLSTGWSLGTVGAILLVSALASLRVPPDKGHAQTETEARSP